MKLELKDLSRGDICLGVIVALAVSVICGPLFGVASISLGVMSGGVAAIHRRLILSDLQARAKNSTDEWGVMVNDVEVAVIADAEYAAIYAKTMSDWRVYWWQTTNVFEAVMRFVWCQMGRIAIAAFWVFAVSVLTTADHLRAAGADWMSTFAVVTQTAVVLSMLYMAIEQLSGRPGFRLYGYVNFFRESAISDVRHRMNVSAKTEEITLWPKPSHRMASADTNALTLQ